MAIQKMIPAGSDVAIYGEPDNINYFLNSDLVPASAGAVVNKEAIVGSSTRRKYAGDPAPSNVKSHTREFLYDPGRRNGAAVPGKPFILDDGIEKRQFSFTGNFVDLHAFFVGDAKMALTLYSPSAAYSIAKAGGGGG